MPREAPVTRQVLPLRGFRRESSDLYLVIDMVTWSLVPTGDPLLLDPVYPRVALDTYGIPGGNGL